MKKLLSLLIMLSLLLSGAALAEEGEVIELRFQRIGNDAAETEFWNSVIADYEAANPGVKILYDDAAIGDAMDAKLNTLFAANYGPDIIGHGILSVAQRAELGHYIPIDEYFAAWEDGDDMMESVLANGTYKGQLYGLGYSATPYVFAYRIDLLEEAGLEVPTTWEELKEAALALTVRDDAGNITRAGFAFPMTGGNMVEYDVFVFGNGGLFMDEDSNPTLDTAEALEAFEFLETFLADVNIPYDNNDTNPFISGNAAMTLINCNMLVIGRDCQHPEEAFDFITFALSPEIELRRAEMLNVPVTRTSLVDAYIELDPYNAARAECVEIGVGMPRAIWSTQFQTIRNEMVQKVLFGESDPATALSEAQEKLEEEIEFL